MAQHAETGRTYSELAATLGPSSAARRLLDRVLELSGAYRIPFAFKGVIVSLGATIKSPSRFVADRDVVVQHGAIVHCGGKAWSNYAGFVRAGEGVKIGPYCILYGAGGIEMAEHVHLGPGVKIMSQAGKHDSNRLSASPTYMNEPVRIGAGSWIGAGAVVLGGSSIGRCVSVAPNSVVGGVVPDGAVVAGSPARTIFHNTVTSK